jgi:hypothetical protein
MRLLKQERAVKHGSRWVALEQPAETEETR